MNRLKSLGILGFVLVCATSARADNWVTGTEVGADTAANINTKLAAGAGTGTITINDASTILVDTADIINCTGILISHASAAITFSAARKIVFANAAGAITFSGTGALTINGEEAAAGFDFVTTAASRTLTITSVASGTLNDASLSNRILLGNGNTLRIVAGGTPVINSVVMSGTGTLAIDASATVTTLTPTNDVTLAVAAGLTLTITNAVTVPTTKIVTFTGTNDASAETLVISGGLTLNGAAAELNITGDNTTAMVVTGTVTAGVDAAVLDVDASASITAVNMTATVGDLTLEVAAGKTLTTTIDVNDNALTISQSGTVTTVQMDTAAGVLTVNESSTITAVNGSQNFTINVASGKTLTTTATIAANTMTLTGTGTVSRVDATTGTITDNGGTTVSDLRATFGAGGTFTWGGSGSGTITTLANALPGAGETLNKVGTGTLTIAGGFTTAFANAAGVKLDIDAGTVVLGSAGTNDDVTFDDDADEITVASGATLTTFGSFSVGAAGANVNLDAAAGSTINLNSTAGAETIAGAADDDYNLLGTVNINGANGDYTINDAFNYKFGSISINTTGSLINNQPSGELKFVPNSVVTVNGSAIFIVNGQSSAALIIMDTTTGVGAFTVDRTTSTSSANVTIHNVSLNRSTYTSSSGQPAGCELTLSSVEFGTGLTNWVGCTSAGGGGGGSTPGEGTTTPTPPPVDVPPPDTGTTPDTPVDDPATDQVADDGSAEVNTDSLSVSINGLLSGTVVSLQTDDSGVSRLTIGEEQDPDLTVVLAGFEQGANLDLFAAANGDQILSMSNPGGNEVPTLLVKSGTGHSGIRVTLDDDGNQDIAVNGDDGSSIILLLNAVAQDATVGVGSDDQGNVSLSLSEGTGENMDVFLTMSETLMVVTFGVTYDEDPPANPSARIKTGFPGLQDEESLGGSVTLSASGLTDESIISVALTYEDSDLQGVEETDLRLHRFSPDSGLYEPAGTSDVGVGAPTGVLGDYGVDVASNSAWAEVASLGKFAIGVPLSIPPTEDEIVTPLDGLGPAACGAGGTCGALGLITMPMCYLGLMGLRRSIRRRPAKRQ